MRDAARALSFFLLAIALPLQPFDSQAQGPAPIEVTEAGADYSFGQQAEFTVEATAEAGITALYLYLQLEGQERVEVLPLPFEPGPTVRVRYQRDLRFEPFPPFGLVTWWWEVRDGADQRLMTEPRTFQYLDDRFAWRVAEADHVRVYAAVDDPVYVQAALDIAETSLLRIAQMLGAQLVTVDIYLYPSLSDLQSALELGGRDWVGGEARPDLGVVLVAIPPGDAAALQMERDIPHELTHMLLYQVVGAEGYAFLPAWLDEGLATMNETHPDPHLDLLLEQAQAEGQLIPTEDLCGAFSADPGVARLSYAQSGSLVRYIRDRYGGTGIRALLAAYADGASCEGGVVQGLGITLERLDLAWRADLRGLSGWASWLSDHSLWLMLWGMSLLLALPMVGGFRRR
ncbi:MAG: hypothetical protein JW900_06440 [Anaerolineae bacterium]|nr:hypothetical protein [Anaerolineae bacterium]